tara:strand:- start:37202 stop:37345 length:144 start_codon:yes stop_codon:yes gene_type:complete
VKTITIDDFKKTMDVVFNIPTDKDDYYIVGKQPPKKPSLYSAKYKIK